MKISYLAQRKMNGNKVSFGYVDSYAKLFLILYPLLENTTTPIAIELTVLIPILCKTYFISRRLQQTDVFCADIDSNTYSVS